VATVVLAVTCAASRSRHLTGWMRRRIVTGEARSVRHQPANGPCADVACLAVLLDEAVRC
jgi:hypothetical protein